VRYQPDSDVAVAEGVSITFSAPMVALDSVDAAVSEQPCISSAKRRISVQHTGTR
jgi:hypothetical protein